MVDIREVVLRFLWVLMSYVEADMGQSVFFISLSMARATISRGANDSRGS